MATTILKNIKEAPKGKASQHLINSIKYIICLLYTSDAADE